MLVFGVTLHAANTEHKQKFFYLLGINALEDNTKYLTSF